MNKTLKIMSIILMAIMLVTSCVQVTFAAQSGSDIVGEIDTKISTQGADATKLTDLAGRVLGLIQIASAVAAVILVAVFGFKFIMGSAQEKSDYQKSFIPLIVGVVVVFSATSIAKLLFSLMG